MINSNRIASCTGRSAGFASQARAIHDGEVEDEDDTWVLFLVPVTDPLDDEDE